ncbi:MAG: histidine phosphatase family protein [Spirochaetales bacterium]|nr:histidine phosphatase family protein [Spirochaetales bacterium]
MSSKSFLYIARHGQTEWNLEKRLQGRQDSPLTPLGKFQAELLARSLVRINLSEIWSSTAPRALTTAQIIDGYRMPHLGVQTSNALQELDFGPWEGKTKSEINELWRTENEKFWLFPDQWVPQKQESFLQVRLRLTEFVQKQLSPGSVCLWVSHGLAIQIFLWALENSALSNLFQNPVVHQTSLTLVEARPGEPLSNWKVVFRDDRSHLKELEQRGALR